MFEFSVARKYLIPKRNQLSVSFLALLSVAMISLVVWLVLVFLSVTEGIEKGWLEKLTSLNAPLRLTPTSQYYDSYYYQADSFSAASGYSYKSIKEKADSPRSDPYSADVDPEMPSHLTRPEGALLDPVKKAYAILNAFQEREKGFVFQDYEISGALMRLEMQRAGGQTFLTQVSYVASLSEKSSYQQALFLTKEAYPGFGTGVFLPKSFQDNGVQIGDHGYLAYTAATPGGSQEQRLPIFVNGFYDPGIMSIGARLILTPPFVPRMINSASTSYAVDKLISNGIQVWMGDLKRVDALKSELSRSFVEAGIAPYWKISTYREYDFAKDLIEQFQSDRYLFTLVGIIILLVAACNIVSLLVLLVNDKKKEIGTLLAMGASRKSIGLIFGICGIALGGISSAIGALAALFTLRHIDAVVKCLSFLQGHEAFNAAFYGKSLPSELSTTALYFILIVTPLLALLSGIIPAIKASRLNPSHILRSE